MHHTVHVIDTAVKLMMQYHYLIETISVSTRMNNNAAQTRMHLNMFCQMRGFLELTTTCVA